MKLDYLFADVAALLPEGVRKGVYVGVADGKLG